MWSNLIEIIRLWFSKGSNITLTICISVVTVAVLFFCINLVTTNSDLRNSNITIQNQLAESDSLHRYWLTATEVLSVKFAKQAEDLNKSEDVTKVLRAFLKERDAMLYAYGKTAQETKLENIELKGQLKKDEHGYDYAQFDSTTWHFSIAVGAYVLPQPRLLIQKIIIPDSTTFGIYQEGDFVKGFITHKNPHVIDAGGTFVKKIDLSVNNAKLFSIPWYYAIPIYLAGVGTGLLVK